MIAALARLLAIAAGKAMGHHITPLTLWSTDEEWDEYLAAWDRALHPENIDRKD